MHSRGLCLAVLLALLVPVVAVAADPWQLVGERDGIRVYMQKIEGSRLKTFRGVAEIEVKDWQAIGAVINDYANAPRWLHYVSALQEIGRRGPLDRDLIIQTDLPWPVADREAVVRGRSWNPAGTHDTVIRFENAPALLPPNEDYVRFPVFNARFDFHWLGGHRVQVTYEIIADPGGYIPDWIANIVLQDAPYLTLRRFAVAINRPEYQGRYYDYIVTPPGFGQGR